MKDFTINDLAIMVQKGFEETAKKVDVDRRFGKIDEDMGLINGRLDAIEMELIDIKKKLDNIIYRHEFEILKDRIEALEKELELAKK